MSDAVSVLTESSSEEARAASSSVAPVGMASPSDDSTVGAPTVRRRATRSRAVDSDASASDAASVNDAEAGDAAAQRGGGGPRPVAAPEAGPGAPSAPVGDALNSLASETGQPSEAAAPAPKRRGRPPGSTKAARLAAEAAAAQLAAGESSSSVPGVPSAGSVGPQQEARGAVSQGGPEPVVSASSQPATSVAPLSSADAPTRTAAPNVGSDDAGSIAVSPEQSSAPRETRAPEARSEGRPSERAQENRPFVRPFEASEKRSGEGRPDARTGPEPRAFENRGAENRPHDGRALPGGGLRFRGRDGRPELRRGPEPRGPEPRGFRRDEREPWREEFPAPSGRGFNRDAEPRDNARPDFRAGRGDQGPNQGHRGDRDNPREMRGMDRIERDALRAKPELELVALEAMPLDELRRVAREMGEEAADSMDQERLTTRVLEKQAEAQGLAFKRGILEILGDSKGFLRTSGYLAGDEDVYVSPSQIKRFNLKTGDIVSGQARPPKGDERHFGLLRVEAINGQTPESMKQRKDFEKLTPIFPDERWRLETTQENITARIIDLVSPIGKGQRGLIVAPPKAGKTTLIKSIANSIAHNHPEAHLIVLLIDERPEEVTDISRSVRGEVVASTFDETPENHMRVAEMVMEKAKRMVEQKKDVVLLLDSITRLSRASNLVVTPSGRTMSGGLDPAAMHKPKRMLGAARNIEEGGSLTILATTLVDTNSRMDEYIFEEFKGTGNMDLVLDRNLFDQRVFPAIDINKSGTRRDDLLMSKDDLAAVFHLRRTLAQLDNDKAISLLIDRLRNTKTNADFMQIVAKSARQGQVHSS
jgi:transcription termination factor Rho